MNHHSFDSECGKFIGLLSAVFCFTFVFVYIADKSEYNNTKSSITVTCFSGGKCIERGLNGDYIYNCIPIDGEDVYKCVPSSKQWHYERCNITLINPQHEQVYIGRLIVSCISPFKGPLDSALFALVVVNGCSNVHDVT